VRHLVATHIAMLFSRTLFVTSLLAVAPVAFGIDTNRAEVREFIDDVAKEHRLQRSDVRALLRNAQTKQSIIETMTRPAEQVFSWPEYRARFLTDRRINAGVDFADKHQILLERVTDSGVGTEAVLGILGVETLFGAITGRDRVLDALTTLAFDYPPRADFFRSELEQFIVLAREERVDARKALGSYAGAIGAPQFMPSNYRKLAVDGDGNGKRDLWTSWPDIVMSIANYLQHHGWQANQPVLASATVDGADLAKFDTSRLQLNETVASLRAKGARFETTMPDDAPAMLIVTEGADANEYRVGFQNFMAIARYNPRIKYALAVHDLGEAIARAREDGKR
jgi:membrane-bound lytic murein transglycosylase B